MVGAGTLAPLTAAIAATSVAVPVTGGLSYIVAAPIAVWSGVDVAVVILALAVGLALLIVVSGITRRKSNIPTVDWC